MTATPPANRQAFLTRAYSRNEIFWDMDNVRQYDVCVVGDDIVGKSTLITQLFKESFLSIHVRTTEGTVQQKQIKLMDKSISSEEISTIMLNVYDTCSKDDKTIETFLSHKTASDGLGFMFVYSITSRASAESFFKFKKYITSLTIDGEIPPIVIVGNQADKESAREVKREEGEELSRSLYVPFMELSATNTSQVREAFFTLIREISYRKEQDKQPLQKEDWLEKKAGLRKIWKTRWFVLEDLQLRYYTHQRESRKDRVKGAINLVECQVADHPKHGLALVITTNHGKRYVLRASSMEQKSEWARLIIRAREKILLSMQQNPPPAISPRSESFVSASSLANDILEAKERSKQLKSEELLSSSPSDTNSPSSSSSSTPTTPSTTTTLPATTASITVITTTSSSSSSISFRPRSKSAEASASTPSLAISPSMGSVSSGTSNGLTNTNGKPKERSPRDTPDLQTNGVSEGSTLERKKSREDVTDVPCEGNVSSPKLRKKPPSLFGLFIGRTDH